MRGPKGRAHVLSNLCSRRFLSKSKRSAKTDWHALSLQQLTNPEFIRVVNLILADEYSLLPDLFQLEGNISTDVSSRREEQPIRAADTSRSSLQNPIGPEFAYL